MVEDKCKTAVTVAERSKLEAESFSVTCLFGFSVTFLDAKGIDTDPAKITVLMEKERD